MTTLRKPRPGNTEKPTCPQKPAYSTLQREVYRDKGGRKRHCTPLQERIVLWHMDNYDKPLSECSRVLKCSPTAVYKTLDNPVCAAFAAEIRAMVLTARVMPFEERQAVLSQIARTNITDVIDSEGKVTISKENPATVAVSEYVVTEDSLGKQTRKVRMYSKLEAITILDKQDKIYSDMPPAQGGNITFNIAVIDKEAEALLARVLIGKRGLPPPAMEGATCPP